MRLASGQGKAHLASARDVNDVPAGELQVYRMPNAARERDVHRPRVDIEGASRLVVLAPMGNVLSDTVAAKHHLDLPAGTERFVVVPGAEPHAEVAGFMASTRLAQIGRKTLLGPGCVVDSSALRVRRFAVTEVRASWVRASEAMTGASELVVRFTSAPRAIAVVLEQADGSASAADVELILRGATLGASPWALITGGSVVLVYEVVADDATARADRAVVATLAKTERVHLGGLLGFARGAEELAALLRDHDVHDLLGPLARPSKPARVRFHSSEGAARRA